MRHNKMCPIGLRSVITAFLAFAGGMVVAAGAQAEDLGTSQKRVSDGYRDYYNQLRKSSQPMSAEQKSNAARSTTGAAIQKHGDAIRSGRKEGVRAELARDVKKPRGGNLAKRGKEESKSRTTKRGGMDSVRGQIVLPSAPSRPETVLDGSGVPREMEFPGKKSDSGKIGQ